MLQRYGFRIITSIAAIVGAGLVAASVAQAGASIFGPVISALHKALS